MPIAIPQGRSRTGMALSEARVRSSRPLAWLSIVSFSVVTAISGSLAWLAHRRDTSWAAALATGSLADIDAAATAADRALLVSRITWIAIGVAALVVAAWSRSLTCNAQARGVTGLRPNRTALSWFVPGIGPASAIREIGRLVREFDYSERRLWFWLFGFHVYAAVMIAGQIVVTIGFDVSVEQSWSLAAIHRQTQVFALQAAMSLVVTLLAIRAIRHADRAVSGGRRPRSSVDRVTTHHRPPTHRARRPAAGASARRVRHYTSAA